MNCEDYVLQMSLYLDGELPLSQLTQLLEHIEICEECKKEYEALEEVVFKCRSVSWEAPDGLHEKIMSQIEVKPAKKIRRLPASATRIFAYAAVIMLLLSGAVLGFNNRYSFFGFGDKSSEEYASDAPSDAGPFMQDSDSSKNMDEPGNSGEAESAEGAVINISDILPIQIPANYAFYEVAAGSGEIPAELVTETKVAYPEYDATFVYVANDEEYRQTLVKAVEESGYNILECNGLPDTDETSLQGIFIIIEDEINK